VALHLAEQTAIGLLAGLLHDAAAERESKDHGEDHDHHEAAGELGGEELPAEEDEEDQAELEDQVGRANSKITALPRVEPFRNRVRATATAA
jgi:hypothetical protein